jgi:hypothetical protein
MDHQSIFPSFSTILPIRLLTAGQLHIPVTRPFELRLIVFITVDCCTHFVSTCSNVVYCAFVATGEESFTSNTSQRSRPAVSSRLKY